jgi:hypothetical protein
MDRFSSIVMHKATAEILGEADVVTFGVVLTLQNVYVEEISRAGGVPSRSREGGPPSPCGLRRGSLRLRCAPVNQRRFLEKALPDRVFK